MLKGRKPAGFGREYLFELFEAGVTPREALDRLKSARAPAEPAAVAKPARKRPVAPRDGGKR